jgi:type IV secretion system protein VirB9
MDPHIRILAFDPDRVFALHAAFGFQLMIQFSPNEQIENVSIGDGSAWQITPNKTATLLFIKPIEIATATNMTVVTDRRAYLFELTADPAPVDGPPVYALRFTYGGENGKAAAKFGPPEHRNIRYTYRGSSAILPSEVFDDGHFTYFKWAEGGSTPALFVVGADGGESVVNYSVRDGYQVVEQTAAKFILRDGKKITTVTNNDWQEPVPPPGAPQKEGVRTVAGGAESTESR